jgi:hypothetical protein
MNDIPNLRSEIFTLGIEKDSGLLLPTPRDKKALPDKRGGVAILLPTTMLRSIQKPRAESLDPKATK